MKFLDQRTAKIKRDVLRKKMQCSYNLSDTRHLGRTRQLVEKKKYCVEKYHGWERRFPLGSWMNLIKKVFHLFEKKGSEF